MSRGPGKVMRHLSQAVEENGYAVPSLLQDRFSRSSLSVAVKRLRKLGTVSRWRGVRVMEGDRLRTVLLPGAIDSRAAARLYAEAHRLRLVD